MSSGIISYHLHAVTVATQESMEKFLSNYPSDERRTAKRMMKEGTKAKEEDMGDGVIRSYVSGATVIIRVTKKREKIYCFDCESDQCAHCIVARVCREGLSWGELKGAHIPLSEIEIRITSLWDEVSARIYDDDRPGRRKKWDEGEEIYDTAAEIAIDIGGDIIESAEDTADIIRLIDLLANNLDELGYGCCDAIYEVLDECEDDLRDRLSEMSAEEYADAVIGQEYKWLLDAVPHYGKEDMEYLMDRFEESGIEAAWLKGVYFALGKYEEFIKDSGEYVCPDDLMEAAVALDKQGNREAAREAASRIGAGSPVLLDNKEFMRSMDLGNNLAKCIENNLRTQYDEELFSELVGLIGGSERDAVLVFTQRREYLPQKMLCAFTDMGYADDVDEYVREHGYRPYGSHMWTSVAESMARAGNNKCAVLLRRNGIADVLDAGKSVSYEEAVSSLKVLEEMHASGKDSSVDPSHEKFLADIREKHGRKYKFWGLLDGTYR